jgi:hypothetical protein
MCRLEDAEVIRQRDYYILPEKQVLLTSTFDVIFLELEIVNYYFLAPDYRTVYLS